MKETLTISVKEAAQLIGISQTKVRRLVKSGELRSHRLGPRYYLLKEEVIEDIKKAKP